MKNDIRYIIETYPFLLNLYQKEELRHIKDIYFDHTKHKRIIENKFDFIKFVAKLHSLGYTPHEYSIIRYNIKEPFSETNIHLKKANNYQKKLEKMSKIIGETDRHKIKIKLNEDPYIIIKSEDMINKPAYKLHTKQDSPTSTTDLTRYYPKTILKKMRDAYSNKKRTNLIQNGFTFEKYVKKAYELGFLNTDSHQVRRIDTAKPFSSDNMRLRPTDGMQAKLKTMSKIMHENKRVALKINEENPFQICLKHPHRKYERRIYIKP